MIPLTKSQIKYLEYLAGTQGKIHLFISQTGLGCGAARFSTGKGSISITLAEQIDTPRHILIKLPKRVAKATQGWDWVDVDYTLGIILGAVDGAKVSLSIVIEEDGK